MEKPSGDIRDRKIPALHLFFDRAFVKEYMAKKLGRSQVESVTVQVLKYKPGKRCVLAFEIHPGEAGNPTPVRLLGKVMRKQRAERAFRNYQLLDGYRDELRQIPLRIPRGLWLDTELDFFALEALPGLPVGQEDRQPDREILAQIARVLAGWHRITPSELDVQPVSYFVQKYVIKNISSGDGALNPRITQLIGQIKQRVDGMETVPALVHGDLSLHHILRNGQELAFVDLDGVVRSRPEVDLAYVMVQLITRWGREGMAAAETFLHTYWREGGRTSPPVLNVLMASFFLRKWFIENKKQSTEKDKLASYAQLAEWYLKR